MIVRALTRFFLLIALASLLIFALLRAVPGDPARVALGVTATDEDVAALSALLGTDRPLIVQYLDWAGGLLTGDLGVSMASRTPIGPVVAERAGVSLTLTVLAMLASLAIAVPLGVYLAQHGARPLGMVVAAAIQVGIVVPSFMVAILLVAVLSVRLGWLPAGGWESPAHLVAPVASLALVQAAILTRYSQRAITEEMGKDYVRTARAKGARRSATLYRHALRNAALPVLTVAGIQLSSLVVGAVVIERVFALPGLGTMLLDAVANRDLTTVQTVMMLLVAFTLTVNLVVDLLYAAIDPRVRRPAAKKVGA
ncbi:ABC transporter permease [Corynebacterium liangguodongii]|uniref:ABC transporter permease n=1 Tax=Corynebacterium liangguodongii TaxID=2079535 RepID=A0A2S0WFG4_9CORY|nr:ABC transporter permease [Corynebacterium liangguodongii]AWB84490.1 ABC transporter permease [Corynebacterium liangguodongii]PWB98708.1 ABC transporter permease [Corynebacterium liangguodongii]